MFNKYLSITHLVILGVEQERHALGVSVGAGVLQTSPRAAWCQACVADTGADGLKAESSTCS